MSPKWHYLPDEFPTPYSTVWVRRFGSEKPFQALYSPSDWTFLAYGSIPISWVYITKWREI